MKKKTRTKKKRHFSFSTLILVVILIAGIAILLYPTVSDWWNSMHATQAIASYVTAVDDLSEKQKQKMFKAARAYNKALSNGANFNLSDEEYAEYEKILDITGTGIMGYIQIPSLKVNLPVYHGTEEGVLQIAVGHVAGSSLPVGGKRTHSVLSGHRGLPSAKLFTDLDKLAEGDIFTVTVLDETITYKIDQIRIVLPEEIGDLAIVDDEDYCTLVTCTPYGVNTHRILARGTRTDNIAGDVVVVSEAVKIPAYIVMPAVGIPLLFILLAGMLIYYRRRGPKLSHRDILDEIKKK